MSDATAASKAAAARVMRQAALAPLTGVYDINPEDASKEVESASGVLLLWLLSCDGDEESSTSDSPGKAQESVENPEGQHRDSEETDGDLKPDSD